MQVVYAKQQFPEVWSSAIFLAGPTPRSEKIGSWRPDAIRMLVEAGYDGVVLVPEPEDGEWGSGPDAYVDQVEWERAGLELADVIVFWIPRSMPDMPALTTNVEFGRYVTSGKTVLGAPDSASSIRYLEVLSRMEGGGARHSDLAATLDAAVGRIRTAGSAVRAGGERAVPLHIWHLPSFQAWYVAQRAAGNRLDDARLLWHFRPPKARVPFAWSLWVKVWIADETRHKENEFVLSRPDSSCVVLWERDPDLLASKVILVREFRSSARTPDGYIHELAGGSSWKPGQDPLVIAADEVHEETGLLLDPARFESLSSRQVAGTFSTHHAHVFAVRLSPGEMAQAQALADAGTTHGVEEDTERTYVEVSTFRGLLEDGYVDWAALGMVFAAAFGS